MKKILPFILFFPLVLFSIYLGFTQRASTNKNTNKNTNINTNTNTNISTNTSANNNTNRDANINTISDTNIKTNNIETPTPIIGSANTTPQINLIITAPESGITTDDKSVVVSGTTGSKVNVVVNEQELVSGTDGEFKTTVLLDEGDNYISVVAYDDQGNTAERELLITRSTAGL